MWRFIIRYIHSVQTVKKIQGNLQLRSGASAQPYYVRYGSDGQHSQEHQALLEQRAHLVGEVTGVLAEVHQLQRELTRIRSDLQTAEREYQKETELLRDFGRRTCLLRVYQANSEDTNAQNDAYRGQIDGRINTRTKRIVESDLHLRSDNESVEGQAAQLETTATRNVRESCETIKRFLQEALPGSSAASAGGKVNKDQLWKQVESTLSVLNIQQVVASLEQLSSQEAQALREHTARVSISQDAQKLRFKYEKGGLLRDVSAQPSMLQSVHQLLEESQMQHVLRFVETEKHRNATHILMESLEKTRGRINTTLKKYMSALHENIPIATTLVQAKLDLAADSTARDCYRQAAETLREKVGMGHRERDTLLTIHRKIQDFSELANAKQYLIQVVAKQNAGAQTRLATQKAEISKYVLRSLLGHEQEVQTVSAGLKESVIMEVDKFTALAMPYLAYIYLDSATKCGVLDLSILHHSHPSAILARQSLQDTLKHLHIPEYKAAECILRHCLRLKQELEADEDRARRLRESCQRVTLASGVQTSLDNISELCEKVSAQDKHEMESLLPLLQKRISKAARASTECIKVKDSVQAWWDHPAQFVTPWLTAEGQTYQQWYNKWRIIATNIRQIYVGK